MQITKLLIITIAALMSFSSSMYAENPPKKKTEIPIIKDGNDTNRPRTPDYGSDITAFYQDGAIYLQFAYDMGEVEISVTNETTGEMWQQTEDSAFGSTSIATSTDAGNYYITIVTDDTSCYSGSFSL